MDQVAVDLDRVRTDTAEITPVDPEALPDDPPTPRKISLNVGQSVSSGANMGGDVSSVAAVSAPAPNPAPLPSSRHVEQESALSLEQYERKFEVWLEAISRQLTNEMQLADFLCHLLLNPFSWLQTILNSMWCRALCWQREEVRTTWSQMSRTGGDFFTRKIYHTPLLQQASQTFLSVLGCSPRQENYVVLSLSCAWHLLLVLLLAVIPYSFAPSGLFMMFITNWLDACNNPTTCDNLDDGALDVYLTACEGYVADWCGVYDDSDFSSYSMCCVCGGGAAMDVSVSVDCSNEVSYGGCVLVLYLVVLGLACKTLLALGSSFYLYVKFVRLTLKQEQEFMVVYSGEFLALHDVIGRIAASLGDGDVSPTDEKFTVNTFRTKDPVLSALGLAHFMHVSDNLMYAGMAEGVPAIVREIRAAGDPDDIECLEYVLSAAAGSSDKPFPNGTRDTGRHGEMLADFVSHPDAQAAKLKEAHVLALRLYTTKVFQLLNNPLRSGSSEPHPCPVTIGFLNEGIRRLRAVEAAGPRANQKMDLWRGMNNLSIVDTFINEGGTESAPMSTTSDVKICIEYALAHGKRTTKAALLLKLRTNSFLERGADLQFLSAFPGEKEICYPPLTHLRPTGRKQSMQIEGVEFRVIEVTPSFST